MRDAMWVVALTGVLIMAFVLSLAAAKYSRALDAERRRREKKERSTKKDA